MPSALLLQGELPEWAEDHIQAQWAEIKRLKAEIEQLQAEVERLQAETERRQAEVERRQAGAEMLLLKQNIELRQQGECDQREIERLRDALSDEQRHDDGERPHD